MADIRGTQDGNAAVNFLRSRSAPELGALIAGGLLAIVGLTRRSKAGLAVAAAGGTLAYMVASRHSPPSDFVARGSVLLNCSQQEAYRFWRDFENLPHFMRRIESVTRTGERQSRWVALGPGGTRIEWTAEITDDVPDRSIAWRSLPDSDLNIEWGVSFRPAPDERGTILEAKIHYRPTNGAAPRRLTQLISRYPSFWIRQDLRRLKALIETGEIPTIEGQTHGPRSGLIAAARMMDPDRPVRRESRMSEVFNAMRRIA